MNGAENRDAIRRGERTQALRQRTSLRRWALFGACVSVALIAMLGNWLFSVPGAVIGASIGILVGVNHIIDSREETDRAYQHELRAIDSKMPGEQ